MNLRVESAQSEISDLQIEIRQKNALLVSEGLKGSTMESRLRQVESENRDRMEELESQVGELEHELSFLTANLAETQDLVQNLYVDAENTKKLLDSAEG
jgi:chromosome segregation ATPase